MLHTDTALLPRRRAAWSSWNFHLARGSRARGSTVTYWMNNLQRLRAEREYLVTLNRGEEIDPEKVLRRISSTTTPCTPPQGVAAQARHAEISGVRRTHYCGAYWGWGFHEDGVVSALRACEGIAPESAPTADVSEVIRHIEASNSDTPFRGRGDRRVSASAVYEGTDPPPALRAGRARASATGSSSCTSTSTSCRACSTPTRSGRPAARAPARFRRADFMGDPARPLDECARDAVEAATGERPAGPVRLLAGLRYLGHSFNPVSFYYCFDRAGERVEAVVADVENIPWGERHPYVLARGEREGTVLSDELDKALHVSPLMGMDQTYAFRADRARRAARRPHRVAPRAGERRQVLRRHPLAAPPRAEPAAAGAGCWPATRRCRCRSWRRSTPSRCG